MSDLSLATRFTPRSRLYPTMITEKPASSAIRVPAQVSLRPPAGTLLQMNSAAWTGGGEMAKEGGFYLSRNFVGLSRTLKDPHLNIQALFHRYH